MAALPSSSDKEEAQGIVRDIIAVHPAAFQLNDHDSIVGKSSNSRVRSSKYAGWLLLCHVNTATHCGFIVCKYFANNVCPVGSAVRVYKPSSGGTNNFSLHMDKHDVKHVDTKTMMWNLDPNTKSQIARAASAAVFKNLHPISWTHHKAGVLEFATAMFEAGQSFPAGRRANIANAMPFNTAIKNSLLLRAKRSREHDSTAGIRKAIESGGGMSSDGLKQSNTGKTFYDLTLHFFEFGTPNALNGNQRIILKNKLLFLTEHDASLGETALAIKSTLSNALSKIYSINFDTLMEKFTFVTDCESSMPNVVGGSISRNVAPLDIRWVGCICHQLSTVMRTAFSKSKLQQTQNSTFLAVSKNIENVKTLVRIFKQSQANSKLTPGCALIQEVQTRFSSLYSALKRFIKASPYVPPIVAEGGSGEPKRAWRNIQSVAVGANMTLPHISAVVAVFEPLATALNILEASKTPTMHKVLPLLAWCKNSLTEFSGDVRDPVLSSLASRVLVIMNNIMIHDVYIAALLLHPLLKSCSTISDDAERSLYIARGEKFIRELMPASAPAPNDCPRTGSQTAVPAVLPSQTNSSPVMTHVVHSPALSQQMSISPIPVDALSAEEHPRKKFCFLNVFDSHVLAIDRDDELSTYQAEHVPQADYSLITKDADMGVVRYWLKRKGKYPRLAATAFRLFAIPASSCTSERHFSAVNGILTDQRARLSSELLDVIMYLRSGII